MNPILTREMVNRFRRKRASLPLVIWLVAISALAYLAFVLGNETAGWSGGGLLVSRLDLGSTVFGIVAVVLLSGVLLVVPGVAGLSIASERDRATLQLIQVTQLTPTQIVLGKLGASLLWAVLLLCATAPVLALPVVIGGVDLADLGRVIMSVLVVAVTFGALGLRSSARAKSLRGGVLGAYGWVMAATMLTLVALAAEFLVLSDPDVDFVGREGREMVSVWANPYAGMASTLYEPLDTRNIPRGANPMIIAAEGFAYRQPAQVRGRWQEARWATMGGMGEFPIVEGDLIADVVNPAGPVDVELEVVRSPLWWRTLAIYLALTLFGLVGAVRAVRAPGSGKRRRRRPVTDEIEEAVPTDA